MPYKITKENAELLLKELAAAFRKQAGRNVDVELIIVGGGSILLNYGFRGMTDDFDIISTSDEAIKQASIAIRDKYDLEYNWINSDFVSTSSFSPKLREVSAWYTAYNNGHFVIRTVNAEYLIAMKIVSYREYKSDRSDIAGIILAEKKAGNMLAYDQIKQAFDRLYDSSKTISSEISEQISKWTKMDIADLSAEYNSLQLDESTLGDNIRHIAEKDPPKAGMANIKALVEMIKKRNI